MLAIPDNVLFCADQKSTMFESKAGLACRSYIFKSGSKVVTNVGSWLLWSIFCNKSENDFGKTRLLVDGPSIFSTSIGLSTVFESTSNKYKKKVNLNYILFSVYKISAS